MTDRGNFESKTLRVSVLIPSWKRPRQLELCLRALASQTRLPDQVIVIWQADDLATRDKAESLRADLPFPLVVLHCEKAGVVPAENLALATAAGELIALIDDDAYAPPTWVERHIAHFADPTIGAVGGSAVNIEPGGRPFPERTAEPVGILRWYGRIVGNMYDHIPAWRMRPPRDVTHLVGYNLWLRRKAFGTFDTQLREYWQLFELEACLQVRRNGFRVVFDFGSVVEHHPTNASYAYGRSGDLTVKVYNSAYNLSVILAKHSPFYLAPVRLLYQMSVGSVNNPGVLGMLKAVRTYGDPVREFGIMVRTWFAVLAGWRDGLRYRRTR